MEHFNEAEPITTKCPLLPGQPLNVLNVPIILPDSRSHGRSSSSSSQKEDYRTMNPEDKFMNPRKPPKPSPSRLQTSAAHQPAGLSSSTSPISGMIHRSASQPNSAKYRMHSSKDARSNSPPGSRNFRAAFRTQNETDGQKWHQALSRSKTHAGTPRNERFFEERHNVSGTNLNAFPVPASNVDASAPSTIQSRRALKANGGVAQTPRNQLTVETRPKARQPSPSNTGAPSKNLVTIDESQAIKDAITSNGTSSGGMTTPTGPDLHEKRLPTLPNTPSSVMDEAVRAIDEKDKALDAEVLRSHFSSLTTTTADDTHSRFVPERSRFSEWSTDTEAEDTSPESMMSASTFNNGTDGNDGSNGNSESPAPEEWRTPELSQPTDASTNTDPNTPHLTVHSKPSSPNSAVGDIPPWNMNMSLPQLTVSLSSPHHSGLGIEQMDEVESNPKRHAALFSALQSMESLSLSRSPNGSPILLPQLRGADTERGESDGQGADMRSRASNASFRGQTTMQEMLDELSYLKNMIQAEMDGEPF